MKFTISQELTTNLVELLMDCDYDFSRVSIAEKEYNDEGLTLYLEDQYNHKPSFNDCVIVTISLDEFEQFITLNKINTYKGTKELENGKILSSEIKINEPLAWYENDATEYQRENVCEDVLKFLLENLTK